MPQGAGLGNLLIFALPVLLIVFMFMTQRRRQREVKAVQSSLSVGDEVTTTSGLLGRIVALDERIATLEVSPGVQVRFDRRALAGPAPTAAPQDAPRGRPLLTREPRGVGRRGHQPPQPSAAARPRSAVRHHHRPLRPARLRAHLGRGAADPQARPRPRGRHPADPRAQGGRQPPHQPGPDRQGGRHHPPARRRQRCRRGRGRHPGRAQHRHLAARQAGPEHGRLAEQVLPAALPPRAGPGAEHRARPGTERHPVRRRRRRKATPPAEGRPRPPRRPRRRRRPPSRPARPPPRPGPPSRRRCAPRRPRPPPRPATPRHAGGRPRPPRVPRRRAPRLRPPAPRLRARPARTVPPGTASDLAQITPAIEKQFTALDCTGPQAGRRPSSTTPTR